MGSIEGVEAERLDDVEDIVYVAVGKNVEKNEKLLLWAAKNFGTKKICVLHVHQPQSVTSLSESLTMRDNWEIEKGIKNSVDKKVLGNESIDPAIKAFRDNERQEVHHLLDQYVLTLSLAGVQANKLLVEMDSTGKAIVEAITEHKIKWLVMGVTAHRCLSGANRKHMHEIENTPPLLVLNSNTEAKQSEKLRSEPVPETLKLIDAKDMEGIFRSFSSHCSVHSDSSLNRVIARSELTGSLFDEEEVDEGAEVSETNCRIEQVIINGNSLRQEEFVEEEEKEEAKDDFVKDEAFGSLCANEMSRRKEIEELLAREKQEVQKMKNQRDEIMHQLKMVKDQNLAHKSQIDDSQSMVTELEEKIISAVELLISFREKRDKLKLEHENAVRRVKELRTFVKADTTHLCGTEFPTFTFIEINEATRDFDPSWKIGEGRYGSVYKGLLCNMHVAIKMLPSYGCQSQLEFQRQVEILSRVRHPNILTLIGSCPESRSVVYEYLNNGSLADHLARIDNTPLPWQIRTSIVADICSALIFLHYSEPCIIHGNLKPSKVLLDSNFVGKLGDLGISHLVPKCQDSANSSTVCDNANENLVYLDPEYLVTGKLTPESDLYSFGIILLQLLTGRPLLGLVKDVKCALEKENLKALLDFSAGEWPLDLTEQLAYLALRCCAKSWLDRPDLVSEVWSVLEPIKTSFTNMPPYLTSKKLHRVPSHFVCPIFQEVMKDPYIAADGFTYEADAIRGWLDSGHNTSPMTNLKLEQLDLVPNYALHNAIQEWQQLQ